MKRAIRSWIIILTSFFVVSIIDYLLRISDGAISTGGLSTGLFWFCVLLPTSYAFWLLLKERNKTPKPYVQLFFILLYAVMAFIIFAVLSYLYVIVSGIDSV
jgi:hypothetical protein